jgi:hypothetical protein
LIGKIMNCINKLAMSSNLFARARVAAKIKALQARLLDLKKEEMKRNTQAEMFGNKTLEKIKEAAFVGELEKIAKRKKHPVSEAQRRWAFYAEEHGDLPEGKAMKWSRRVKGKGLPEKTASFKLSQGKQRALISISGLIPMLNKMKAV